MNTKINVTLTDDICFKYIFSKEEILKDFLNSFFEYIGEEERIRGLKTSTEKEMFGKKYKNKIFYGDILAYTNTGKIVSIEMYQEFQKEEFNKSVSYLTRIFSSQLERGEKYKEIHKTIGLNFMKGNYHYNNFYLVNNYGFVNKLNYGVIKDECLEMYLIRLDLVKEKVYNEEEKRFIKWLKIINGKEMEEMREEAKEDEVMERALQFMEEFLADEEIRNVYDKINDVERVALHKGEEKGLKKGEKNGIIKTAKKLLQLNIAIEDISKATGLSIQELKNLE